MNSWTTEREREREREMSRVHLTDVAEILLRFKTRDSDWRW